MAAVLLGFLSLELPRPVSNALLLDLDFCSGFSGELLWLAGIGVVALVALSQQCCPSCELF